MFYALEASIAREPGTSTTNLSTFCKIGVTSSTHIIIYVNPGEQSPRLLVIGP